MKLETTPQMRKEVLDLAEQATSHWHPGSTGTFAAKELGKYARDVDTLLELLLEAHNILWGRMYGELWHDWMKKVRPALAGQEPK